MNPKIVGGQKAKHTHIHTHVPTHARTHACTHTHIHTHTHTHAHIFQNFLNSDNDNATVHIKNVSYTGNQQLEYILQFPMNE